MDIPKAKEILQAFGPCTSYFECTSPEELLEEREGFGSDEEFVKHMLKMEDLHVQRFGDCESPDYPAIRDEWRKDMRPAIVQRLAALGF